MPKPVHESMMAWFGKAPDLVAVQLKIGHPARMLFDGFRGTHVVELDTLPLTPNDTLAAVNYHFPNPDDPLHPNLQAGQPRAFVEGEWNLVVSIALEEDGFEVWILRRHEPAPPPPSPTDPRQRTSLPPLRPPG